MQPYSDPRLREPRELIGLAHKLHASGFLTFRKKARSKVGVFTVAKKDDWLRLVFDHLFHFP